LDRKGKKAYWGRRPFTSRSSDVDQKKGFDLERTQRADKAADKLGGKRNKRNSASKFHPSKAKNRSRIKSREMHNIIQGCEISPEVAGEPKFMKKWEGKSEQINAVI